MEDPPVCSCWWKFISEFSTALTMILPKHNNSSVIGVFSPVCNEATEEDTKSVGRIMTLCHQKVD